MQAKGTLPPLREDHHGVIPYADPKLSLFHVEQEKLDLIQFREECDTDEERAAVDKQIQEYVGREIRKVSGIAALLKYFKGQAAMAKAEEERAAKWRKRWEGSYERLKNMVHGVMMALDLPKVEGATDRFRRQKNPVALEITDAKLVPDQYLRATIKMTLPQWRKMVDYLDQHHRLLLRNINPSVTSEVDAVALKAALQTKIECAVCHGLPLAGVALSPLPPPERACPKCEGTGFISVTVPGARLTQSEHLRVE